jgi:heme o synthase
MSRKTFKYGLGLVLQLVKFRLSLLVTISALMGYLLSDKAITLNFLWLFVGVYMLSAGSSGINQVQERDLDKLMPRTQKRPIPSGRISSQNALLISLLFVVIGFRILLLNGLLPAMLGLTNVIFYNLIYTPLKLKTWVAIIPGGFVGAIPPVIGWTSSGAYVFHPTILFIATFMFLWQLPHFWLLLIIYGKEYEMAGFASISRFLNIAQIKILVFVWIIFTSLFLFLFPVFGIHIPISLTLILAITNIGFICLFYVLIFRRTGMQPVRKAFIAVNSYMMAILIILLLNAVL